MNGMGDESRRIRRERKTLKAMIGIYCRDRHGSREGVCGRCATLMDYADERLDACPYGPKKPACSDCPIHCYKKEMREQVRVVMRYAGPRMTYRHPCLAVMHALEGRRGRTSIARDKNAEGGGK